MQAKCNYCERDYAADTHTHGTSSLKAHLRNCKKYHPNLDKTQAILSFKPKDQVVENCTGSTLSNWKMDQDARRNALARMIIIDELPFKSVTPVPTEEDVTTTWQASFWKPPRDI
ncbi:zf-BED domain-containing protein [Cephalotus follicularis]|uniref:Zf-BED domain-containing protein n=1 Tax=Cephalotus follicularis TaxID=3775 RepID=A0A1Q3BAX0_CEPFO|nr:zf-BED domain-containing protein [Cephalotus follicularis]